MRAEPRGGLRWRCRARRRPRRQSHRRVGAAAAAARGHPVVERVVAVGVAEVRHPEPDPQEEGTLGLNLAARDARVEVCGDVEQLVGRRV